MTKRSKFGWLNFILGLVLVGLGIYTFLNPRIALSGVVILYSILAIATGITDIVFYVKLKSSTGFGPAVSLISGIISILAGFMLLLNPVLGQWIFSVVFPIWFIAHSISRLANYSYIRMTAGKWEAVVSLIVNILGILVGVLMLIYPVVSALSLGYLVAIALVLHGVGNVVEAFSKLGEQEEAGQDELEWQ